MHCDTYKLVQLANGRHSIHSNAYAETMHPAIGPAQEAEALYIDQLKLRDRIAGHHGEFVVWDVGTGGAANTLTFLRCTRDIPGNIHIISFDNTLGPLRFASDHAEQLGYLEGYELVISRLISGEPQVEFKNDKQSVRWRMCVGDFPSLLQQAKTLGLTPPHSIFYDPFSPKKNVAMWTADVFAELFRSLDPQRPCALATYSRSTSIRVALLLAGFFVGQGRATGRKEETTIASNDLRLVENPLPKSWVARAQRSDAAEPLSGPVHRQMKLTDESFQKLIAHPQFK